MGYILGTNEDSDDSGHTDLDPLDSSQAKGGSADESVLESIDAPCFFMHACFRDLALNDDVILKWLRNL